MKMKTIKEIDFMKRVLKIWLCATVTILTAVTPDVYGESDQADKSLYHHDVSDNFIIRWGFQAMCDHVYDKRKAYLWPTSDNPEGVTVNPKEVKRGDIVFVRNIDKFMQEIHPHIENPYVIVTHGELYETNRDYQRKYLEEKNVIAWFSIHPLKDGHEKYFPLPLGIHQLPSRYPERKTINALLRRLRTHSIKNSLVYVNHNANNHKDRKIIDELFADKPFCLYRKNGVSFEKYLADMAHCKFVLSPRGKGPDSYRTWEALLVGAIPVVRRGVYETPEIFDKAPPCEHSQLDDLYQGLPVVIVDSWQEVTEEFLNKKYEEIVSQKYDIRPLYLEYWEEKIRNVRDAFLKNNPQ